MTRRAFAVLAVIVFGVFSTSCMTWRNKEIRTSADYPLPNKGVVSVVKRSGEVVEFSRRDLARIVGNKVVGTALRERDVEIEGPFPAIKRLSDGTVSEVTDAKGQVWSVHKVLNEGPNRMTVRVAEHSGPIMIPLSEIYKVKIMRPAPGLSFLSGLALAGAAYLTWAAVSIGKH